MGKLILISLAILHGFSLFAQKSLSVSSIPDSLKKNSDSVVRFRKTEYRCKSDSKIVVTENFAITIFNERADNQSVLKVFYDANSKVKRIDGRIYNSLGIEINELKSKQIHDYSSYASYTLYSDSRVKVADPLVRVYPYTIEYEYEVEYFGVGLYPSWSPVEDYRQSIEYASLNIYTFKDVIFKTWRLCPLFTSSLNVGAENRYTWVVKGIKAIDQEPYSLPFSMLKPKIYFSVNEFLFFGYHASFKDWKNYGALVNSLIAGKDNLPEATILKMQTLCAGAESDIEKVKRVYEFVQKKVRYVNVSKGVGGYQPIDAQVVDRYGYGDCKVLSNYTKALLKSVGINSFYTEIGSGDYTKIQFEDFASIDQTNHVILVVPLRNDTVWLECTSGKIPFGYIGGDNSNRLALAATNEGGVLLKTPSYTSVENSIVTVADVTLDVTGNIFLKVDKTYKNELFDRVMSYLYESIDEQERRLYSQLELPGTKLKRFNFVNESAYGIPMGKLTYEAFVLQYAPLSGNRLLFKPNIFSKHQYQLVNNVRSNDICIETGFTMYDTLAFKIPIGYNLEFDYAETNLKSEVGCYEAKLVQKNSQMMLFTRKLVLNKGLYPKEKYPEISNFFKQVALSDNKNCVLIKS